MSKNQSGLSLLESLAVIIVCVVLLWIVVPVAMVKLGIKEAGAMVVTDGDRAPEFKGVPLDPEILKPRVEKVTRPDVVPVRPTKLPPSLPRNKGALE
jgi:hypothetical protein